MEIISVGIDIGTTTTQVVFSQLSVKDTASYFSVPEVDITDKKVIYKSKIMMTPLENEILIDGKAVRLMVEEEYNKAGFTTSDIDTGAVIITGESALKKNANTVLENLSSLAGEFVVSTAGPDLEAIIAGKGSGAYQYSIDHQCIVANIDIGGGTTNIVLFNNGEVISKGSLDIGGRLVKVNQGRFISYVSPRAKLIADYIGINLKIGAEINAYDLSILTDKMNDILEQTMGVSKLDELAPNLSTAGSTKLKITGKFDYIFFTGGVAELIYNNMAGNINDLFPYCDIGALLGNSIAKGKLMSEICTVKPSEIIRATVVGAGTYTTSISGSTITYTKDIFPIKNVPVLVLNTEIEEKCYLGDKDALVKNIIWFQEQNMRDDLIIGLNGSKNICYSSIKVLAKCISDALLETMKINTPIIIVVEADIAKALGQAI